jgi:hypothetical protein
VSRLLRSAWLLAVVPVWLGARGIAYALAPANPLARELEGRTGGTAPLLVTVVLAGTVLAVAAGVLAVASLAVRERAALAQEKAPPIAWTRIAARAGVLFVLAAVLFVSVESWLHVRAGLGFHGWHCLVGPLHRDALPFLAALSSAAALVVAAAERLVAWARRVVRALRVRSPHLRPAPMPRPARTLVRSRLADRRAAARGPPCLV